jgi:dynactin complex subunit
MAKKEVVSRLVPTRRATKKKEVEETPAEKKKKLPTYSEKYEESLIKQLFEEELNRKIKEQLDEEESEFYEETSIKHVKRKDGD